MPARPSFEILDHRRTPMGTLTLRRRTVAALEGREVHEVVLGEAFLMSSLFTESERALARLGLDALEGRDGIAVAVGGLGLGYTALAALEHGGVASLVVVEALEAVIDWHRRGLVPLGAELSADPRCRFVHGDFFALAANPELGFDWESPGARFDAVLLDIDHSPSKLLARGHAALYRRDGLERLVGQLTPGGVFALWSDDPPDPDFLETLRGVFEEARAEEVEFPNPLLGGASSSTVYLARRGP